MNYYPFHLGDYTAHTAHLEPLEDLAYRRLLDQYYLREGPLPADIQATAKLVRMRAQAADVEAVLHEFFDLTDDGWRHRRCDEEIDRMRDKQAKARASAQASVEARRASAERSLSERRADAERSLAESPTDVELPTPTPTPIVKETSKLTLAPARPASEAAESAAVLDCPHLEILALWGEVLPSLPQHKPAFWNGTRSRHLRARWRETASERCWRTNGDGMAFFRKLFEYVGRSPFLCGKARSVGRPPFECELAWLVEPQNWAKVLEGKYHQDEAA